MSRVHGGKQKTRVEVNWREAAYFTGRTKALHQLWTACKYQQSDIKANSSWAWRSAHTSPGRHFTSRPQDRNTFTSNVEKCAVKWSLFIRRYKQNPEHNRQGSTVAASCQKGCSQEKRKIRAAGFKETDQRNSFTIEERENISSISLKCVFTVFHQLWQCFLIFYKKLWFRFEVSVNN